MRIAHRLAVLVLALAALAALSGGAGAAKAPKKKAVKHPPIHIFAAVSLTDVFPALDKLEMYSFAGTNTLALQIRNGAPADVFASANVDYPQQLYEDGLVLKPVNFVRNKLVVVVPKDNPKEITNIYDLTKPGVTIDVASPAVPVGSYTLQVLRQMGLSSRIQANVVSEEPDVRSVLAKLVLGQVDAAFVYATDARLVRDDVKVIKVPAWAQPKVTYAVAVVASSKHKAAAQAFIKRLLSKQGQLVLRKFGFLPPPKPRLVKPALRYALATPAP